jgi:large subunit ribosomal protein L17
MRHYKKGRKLGTDASHTKAIKKSLVVALFTNDRIKTTLERAKEIRGDVDRIVTLARRGDVHARRLAIARLGDKDLVAEIFAKVEQGLFQGREGGYTRILKLGKRRGDSAVIVILELVQEPVSKKKDKDAEKDKPATKAKTPAKSKAAAKAAEDVEAVKGTEDAGDTEDAVAEDAAAEDEDATAEDTADAAEGTEDAGEADAADAKDESAAEEGADAAEGTEDAGEADADAEAADRKEAAEEK